jgi:hypothetical protein
MTTNKSTRKAGCNATAAHTDATVAISKVILPANAGPGDFPPFESSSHICRAARPARIASTVSALPEGDPGSLPMVL